MRLFSALSLLSLAACAMPTHIVGTTDDYVVAVEPLADRLAKADVVVLGELHGVTSIHRTHHAIIAALHGERPNMVIAMEMFERDVQSDLLQYLAGVIDEATFLERSRPWKDYARDYRPVIEFARRNGLVVLAANAPRPLASKVAKEGIESVAGNPDVARQTTAPEDEYWDAFVAAMGEHGGMLGEGAMERFYAAQCLKDDTMAETIADYLAEQGGENRPIVVFICGKMHSDHRRGTVQRLLARMPELDVRVLSAEVVGDIDRHKYKSPRDVADYVVVTEERPPEVTLPPARASKPAHVVEVQQPGSKPPAGKPDDEVHRGAANRLAQHAEQVEQVEQVHDEGLRPALGFMPGYGGTDPGVPVDSVREGGPAARGGLREGDVILAIAGQEVADIEDYTEVLGTLKIGSKVPVRVKRADERVDLEIVVGSRPR